jgi:tRNA U34 5-methylaminomethyl-2-thiouridine-forming methyltransferase MnmC
MWSAERFSHLYGQMAKGGVLTTYCAKGVVRRTLQSVGFAVERLAGPVGGKREILRGTK